MESHGKIPWYLVNYPDRRMIKNDSTTAIDRGFLHIGISMNILTIGTHLSTFRHEIL